MPPRNNQSYVMPFLAVTAILLVLGGIIFQIVRPIKLDGAGGDAALAAKVSALEQTVRYQAKEIHYLRQDLNWYIGRGGIRIGSNGRPVGHPPE